MRLMLNAAAVGLMVLGGLPASLSAAPPEPAPAAETVPSSSLLPPGGPVPVIYADAAPPTKVQELWEMGRKRVTLHADRQEGLEVLKRLMKEAGVSYVLRGEIAAPNKVTIHLNNTLFGDALHAVAEAVRVQYKVRGSVVIFTPLSIASKSPDYPSYFMTPPTILTQPAPPVPETRNGDHDIWNNEEWKRRAESGDSVLKPRVEVLPDGTLVPLEEPQTYTEYRTGPDGQPHVRVLPAPKPEPSPPRTEIILPQRTSPREPFPPLPANTPRKTLSLKRLTVDELFRMLEILPDSRYKPDDTLRWRGNERKMGIPRGIARIEGRASGRTLTIYGNRDDLQKFEKGLRALDEAEKEPGEEPLSFRYENWHLDHITAGKLLERLRLPQEMWKSAGNEIRWWQLRGMDRFHPDPGLVRVQAHRDSPLLVVEGRSDLVDAYRTELSRYDTLTREDQTQGIPARASSRPASRHESWQLNRLTVGDLLTQLRLPSEMRETSGDHVHWRQVLGMDRLEPDPGLLEVEGEKDSRTLHVQGRPDILKEFREQIKQQDGTVR